MTNNTVLLDKGIRCLIKELGLLEAEQFIYLLLSQLFDYTEWRKDNLFTGMSVEEISAAADKYCKENPGIIPN
ncbi:hypothetical protein AGMMS49574_22710 [Bacteroidia bacterium]|nr:hypothetical protein AGMMS49574_22710 [Bacteroidia bacterium]